MPEAVLSPNDPVEITRAQLAMFQRGYRLLEGLMSGKETSTPFKRLAKIADPKGELIKLPDIDLADEVAAPIKSEIEELKKQNKLFQDRLEKREKDDKDSSDLRDIHGRIDKVVAKHRLTEDGRKGMIKVMQDRQLADPEAAALVYLDSLPKNAPSKANNYLPSRFNLFDSATDKGKGDDKMEKFFKNPEAAMDEEIANILNEEAA